MLFSENPNTDSSLDSPLATELPSRKTNEDESTNTDPAENENAERNEKDFHDSELRSDTIKEVREQSSEAAHGSMVNKICVICCKERKFHKGHWQPLHALSSQNAIENLKIIATEMEDEGLLENLNNTASKDSLYFYHNICKKNYEHRLDSQKVSNQERKDWHEKRYINKIAFEEVCKFVKNNIIAKNNCFFLSLLETLYKDSLGKLTESQCQDTLQEPDRFRSHLEEKLLKQFPMEISIVTLQKKKIIKPYTGVLLQNDITALQEEDILQKAAIMIRKICYKIKCKKLPDQLTSTDLIKGECEIPNSI